jgi:hypothetical protein
MDDLSWIKLRRFNIDTTSNEYFTISGTIDEVDTQFLLLVNDNWEPWIWHKGTQ